MDHGMKHRQWKWKARPTTGTEEVQDLVEESNWFDSIGFLICTTKTSTPTKFFRLRATKQRRPVKDSST